MLSVFLCLLLASSTSCFRLAVELACLFFCLDPTCSRCLKSVWSQYLEIRKLVVTWVLSTSVIDPVCVTLKYYHVVAWGFSLMNFVERSPHPELWSWLALPTTWRPLRSPPQRLTVWTPSWPSSGSTSTASVPPELRLFSLWPLHHAVLVLTGTLLDCLNWTRLTSLAI